MTIEQQEIVLRTKTLFLTKSRKFKHYLDTLLLLGISLVLFFFIVNGFIKKQGYYNSPYLLFFLMLPIFVLIFYFSQRYLLKLKQIDTPFFKQDNYKIVKEALLLLGWNIKVDNKGFIEAHTDNFGFWTWTDQMISVIITNNKILFNSIGNVDTYATQPFSWGQHSRNKRKFKEMVGLLIVNRETQILQENIQ